MNGVAFANNKKYTISDESNCILENDVCILDLSNICELKNMDGEKPILSCEITYFSDKELLVSIEDSKYIQKTYRFSIAERKLEYLFDRYVINAVYLDNKLIFADFPNENEREKYSYEIYNMFLYCYDFSTKQVNLMLDKAIADEDAFGGYKDKVYFMLEDIDENKIFSLDVNTLKLDKYYDDVLEFSIKGNNIYIRKLEENKFVIKNISSGEEKVINDFRSISWDVVNNNLVFIQKKIIYSLSLITNEKIILGICKKREYIDKSNGNVIYTTSGREYNVLEDRSNDPELKRYFLKNEIRSGIIVMLVIAILGLIVVLMAES